MMVAPPGGPRGMRVGACASGGGSTVSGRRQSAASVPGETADGASRVGPAASRAIWRSRRRALWRWAMRRSLLAWARTSLASAARRSAMNQGVGSAARRSRQRAQPRLAQTPGGGGGRGVRKARRRRQPHGHGDVGRGIGLGGHAGGACIRRGVEEAAVEPLEEGRQEVEHQPLLSVLGVAQKPARIIGLNVSRCLGLVSRLPARAGRDGLAGAGKEENRS